VALSWRSSLKSDHRKRNGQSIRQIPYGKADSRFLDKIVFRNLGAKREEVLAGPKKGLDNAVLAVNRGKVLVVTSDPMSIIPSIGMRESAWMSVHHLASDFLTSGLRPEFAVFDFNLPPELEIGDLEDYFKAVGRECRKLGISIVGGHTGTYPGSRFTIVGGGVLFGFGHTGRYVTPTMARTGDDILMTKGAAIEATGVLAREFPHKLKARLGTAAWRRAGAYISRTSCVEDALVAAQIGLGGKGVTSMHDATEGGVLGGLSELAKACGRQIIIDRRKIFVSEETRAVCGAFGLDPLTTLSGGTLIITCGPGRTDELTSRLRKNEIDAFVIGRVGIGEKEGIYVATGKSEPRLLGAPPKDGYWEAYDRAVRTGRVARHVLHGEGHRASF
jgi:hydrogenase maturation factor